jgi:RNA-directed DNA polymerase
MKAKLRSTGAELHRRMHQPIAETGGWLKQVVRGYFNYHAVPGNLPPLETFRQQIARHWRFTLRRRSQRSRWTWERFEIPWPFTCPGPKFYTPTL